MIEIALRPRTITVVTSGHLSTCPRMLKAADALSAEGHDVRMVATCHEPWAAETDDAVRRRRGWPVTTIDYRRGASGVTYWRTGVRYRAARASAGWLGADRLPHGLAARAYGRVHPELVHAAVSQPADFVYGGTTGALAAVAEAAQRLGVPYGIDFEDLHSAETLGDGAATIDALAARIERHTLTGAAFVTTSNEAIAEAYHERYGIAATTIHNVFPLPPVAPSFERRDPSTLRVYWFSQTIGVGRGLEEAIEALGRSGVPAELTLRGRPQSGYVESLQALAARQPHPVRLEAQAPGDPDLMIDLARGYDVGLAMELPETLSRRLCASNKVFTYMASGLAVIVSDLPGTRAIGEDLGAGAAIVPPGDIESLAAAFRRWAEEPARLECAKRAAWNAAVRRWRFDHELERGRLCALVRNAVS